MRVSSYLNIKVLPYRNWRAHLKVKLFLIIIIIIIIIIVIKFQGETKEYFALQTINFSTRQNTAY